MHLEHQHALDGGTAVDLGVDVEPLHALEVLRLRLIEMREGPAQPLDRPFLVDGLHRRQEALDAAAQLRVHIEVNAIFRQRQAEPLPELERVGGRIGGLREQRVVQREVQSLAVTGQVEPIVALERLDLRHPGDQVVDVGRRARLLVVVVERAHGHLPGIVGDAKRLDVARLHSGSALILERGDAHLVEVVHEEPGVLDRLVPRHLAELVAQQADRGAAVERAGQLALLVLLDLDPARIGRGRLDAHCLERRGVGVDAKVEQLERHRIVRRDAVELRPG